MPWEQMDLPEMSGRLMLVAGYLANRIHSAHIVDLNCGTAPLLGFLGPEWSRYYGNDTNEDFIVRCQEKSIATIFECVPDTEVLDRLNVHELSPDILICLGYGARYHPLESPVVDDVIVSIVDEHQPYIVVLGLWMSIAMLPRCGFNELLGKIGDRGYIIKGDWSIEANHPTTPYSRRRIVTLGL